MPQGAALLSTCLLCSILYMFRVGHIGNSTWKANPLRDAALCNRFARYLEVTKCLGQEQTAYETCNQHKLGRNVNLKPIGWNPKITSLTPEIN
jgi:hypothetical protein